MAQFVRWGRMGGLARRKKMTQIQRSESARKAGIASGKVRGNGNGA